MLLSDIDSWSNRDTNALPHISTRPMRAEEPRLYLGGEYGARRELTAAAPGRLLPQIIAWPGLGNH